MRSWCCLCFTSDDDDEEPDSLPPLVKADHFIEDNNYKHSVMADDSNFGIDDGAVAIAFDNSNPYGETNRAPSLDCAMHGIVLPEDHGGSWRAQGESSSGSVVTPMAMDEKCDRDLHNKRAKVYSNSKPPMVGLEMIFFNNKFKWNNSSGSPFDSSGGRNDEDESDSSKSEDVEVRMDLIDDLLHKVFSFLDPINLCRAAMVCRQWQAANAHKKLKCLNFEKCNISLEQFEDMCQRYPNVIEVNNFGAPATHLLVMKSFSSLRNLEVLTLGKCQLGDPFFHALADCSMLKTLNVNDAGLGNNTQEIRINHDRLRHLQLTKCCVARITMSTTRALSLKRSNMALAALICPVLRLLDIGSCHRLPDAAIRSAATSCPQLESLDMSNCSCVSDETLREIAATCANLLILNASYCPNISLESVRLTMLTILKLHSCEGITSAADIAYSSMLEVLELDNCSLLTSVSLDLPCLQHIRLVHCCNFADLNLTTIMLSSIMVSNCPALQRINITSNSLQKLALQKQKNLPLMLLGGLIMNVPLMLLIRCKDSLRSKP